MGVGKTTFTFSNSSITLDGGSTNINLTRDNQSYTNKLSHGYGDIYTFPSGSTDYTWTPTASQLTEFFEEIPSSKTRPIDVYLDTYNGSTKVGRDVHALTVTLSEATGKPTLSGFTITDSNTVANSMGIIVIGKSRLSMTRTATAKYGANISFTKIECGSYLTAFLNPNDPDYSSTSAINNVAQYAGATTATTTPTSCTISCFVNDSRGFTSDKVSLTKTIVKYENPTISKFEVTRCDGSGNESETGTIAKVVIKGSWVAMKVGTAYKNAATLKVGYKLLGSSSSYTYQTISVTGGVIDINQTLSVTLNSSSDYEFSIMLTDAFGASTQYSKSEVRFINDTEIVTVSADGEKMSIYTSTLELKGTEIINAVNNLRCLIPNGLVFGSEISTSGRVEEFVKFLQDQTVITSGDAALYIESDGIGDNTSLVNIFADLILLQGNIELQSSNITANDHGVENLAWMYCNSSTSTATETYTSSTWTAINMTVKLSGTGDSSNYFTMSTGGKITFKKAGLFRIKLNMFAYTPGGRVGVGIFNGTTEEYSSSTYSGGTLVTASCEALLSVTANSTRIFKGNGWPGSGSNWYLRLTKTYTNVLVEYLGPS